MMDIEDIRRHLPHRYPFLFVDRVVLNLTLTSREQRACSITDRSRQGVFMRRPLSPRRRSWVQM